jgi:hypothetical protein
MARPAAPKPQPAVLRGHQPSCGLGNSTPASIPPVDGPARLRPTKSSFRANSASVHADTAASSSGLSQSGRGFPLTEQEKSRAARPTEPRDSYASGIRIPHSSPSHEATHTWLSGSVSRQASSSARKKGNDMVLHPKIPTCSGPDNHKEWTPAFKVPLQTELQFCPRGYEQPPHRRACGATSSGRLASDLCSSSDGPRTNAAAGRLSCASRQHRRRRPPVHQRRTSERRPPQSAPAGPHSRPRHESKDRGRNVAS